MGSEGESVVRVEAHGCLNPGRIVGILTPLDGDIRVAALSRDRQTVPPVDEHAGFLAADNRVELASGVADLPETSQVTFGKVVSRIKIRTVDQLVKCDAANHRTPRRSRRRGGTARTVPFSQAGSPAVPGTSLPA